MFDLLIWGGTLPDGRVADIGIRGDRIAAVGDLKGTQAGRVIDATAARPRRTAEVYSTPCTVRPASQPSAPGR